MPKVNDFKKIVDDCLKNIQMTETQKQNVLRKVRNNEKPKNKNYKRYYAWGTSIVAACLALVLISTQFLPIFESANNQTSSNHMMGADKTTPDFDDIKNDSLLMDAGQLRITASDAYAGGISTDTSFLISTDIKDMTSQQLEEKLSITPAMNFTVTEQSKGEFLLETEGKFENNTIVNVSYKNNGDSVKTWAFQTESKLTVRSTLPGNNSAGVPLDTGIEIYFSRSVENIEDYFEITPKVNGKFLYENNTVIFVPDKALEEDSTLYTVTIKAGLKDILGSELEEDYTFSFRTPEHYDESKPRLVTSDDFTESYISDDVVSLSVLSNEYFEGRDLRVKLYDLGSAEKYLELAMEHDENINPVIGYASDYEIDTADLKLHDEFITQLQSNGVYAWYTKYIIFPETPECGWYLADIRADDPAPEAEDIFIQKLIQVSDLAVYASTLNGEGVVWVNDAVSGNAAENASVKLVCNDITSVSTADDKGLAYIDVPECDPYAKAYVIADADGHGTFVDSLEVSGESDLEYTNKYYSYVYTDRTAYLPNDTINFWGKLIPKSESTALPDKLEIYLGSNVTSEGTVEVREDGSFEGKIALVNHASLSSLIYFKENDTIVYSLYYTVIEYEKPSYILEMSSEKEYYRNGENAQINIKGSFYSGEPASGLEIDVHVNNYVNVVLDENGETVYTFEPNKNHRSWYAFSRYISASTSGTEDVWVYSYLNFPYFESDYMLNAEKVNENSNQIKISTNKINFSKVNSSTLALNKDKFVEAAKGEAADMSGKIVITRREYVQKQEGTRYNFITKRNEPVYYYDYVETPWIEHEFTTVNGEYISPDFELEYSNSCWYTGEIIYTAPDGAYLTESIFFGNESYYPYSSGNPYVFTDRSESSPRVGDDVEIDLRYKAQVLDSGSMLVNLSQDEFVVSDVVPAGEYSFEFTENYRSSVYVSGAYFDGKHIYDTAGLRISYDSSELALNVDITTDKDDYAPGDTVKANIKLTDENGDPVEADIVVSAVDEAAFAIMENDSNPISALYHSTYYRTPTTYASFVPRFEDGMYAEGGGDGAGEGVRSDFKDNAVFFSGPTGKNGEADISFQLPHNLTSWRLTAAAISDDGHAGIAAHNVTASIPYFINVVYNEEYLSGDDIALSAKPYGSDSETEFTVTVESGDEKLVQNFSGTSNRFTYMNLGKLDAGLYTLTVEAKSGDLRDAVQYPFSVVESKHELSMQESFNMADGINISSLRYPVTIMAYDKVNDQYMRAVSRMLSGGSRFDQKAANAIAETILYGTANAEISSYQTYENGISLFTYGDADAVTTAKALISAPEYINIDGAVQYLYHIIYDKDSAPTDVAAAYMGLASQKEPVLFDIQLLMKTEDFSTEEELYLTLALALLGDQDSAEKWFNDNIKKMESKSDFDEKYRLLSQSLLLAELVNSDRTLEILDFITSHASTKYLPSLDIAAYIKHTDITKDSDAKFTCNINGKKEIYDFTNSRVHVFTMSEDDLKNANFTVLNGDIGVTVRYVSSSENIEDTSKGKIKVKTSYDLNGAADISVGTLIAVTHDISMDDSVSGEQMTLSISIPSGTRFVSMTRSHNKGWSFCGEEEGRISIDLNGGRNSYSVTYYIRSVLPGEFVFEPLIITSNESGARFVDSREVMNIR